MRIAILLLNSGRGSGEVARHQARYLLSSGWRVLYMHPGIGEGVRGAISKDIELHTPVVPVHEYLPSARRNQEQVARMPYERAVRYLRDYERALESVIAGVDIVLGHHANISAVATANVARRAGKPYALFLHGTGIEPRYEGLYEDRVWSMIQGAIEHASGILVTTEYVRDRLVRGLIDLPPERFLVLPCGVDLDEFQPARSPMIVRKYALPERYVICPGALTKSKGPQNVVEASLEYADVAETIFIGDGELRERIEFDLNGRGRVLGFVSAADKADLITAASVLAGAPEKREHFGIIYAEALAAGTPPVAYGGGGVSSIITPETGVLTKRDPKSLGCAIRALLTNPDKLGIMGQEGRRRAEENFSWLKLGRKLQDWLVGISSS
jgi:glycosyltransferase involved in cell wall biosynthesis